MLRAIAVGWCVSLASVASGEMVISEWMYNGAGSGSTGEFIEFTNIGATSVNMTGWSFDDDSRVPGTVSLSGFGVVAPGESVILTDETAANFAAIWGLSGVKIIGGNTANLGRNDEINLYNASGVLVDRLTYGDETYPGTPRTATKSCNVPETDYGYTTVQTSWMLASAYDAYGSSVSTRGELGSPGRVVGYARSDFDHDGDVDLADLTAFIHCMIGPFLSYNPPPSGCTMTADAEGFVASDADRDGDVDLADFLAFQLCYSGEGNPADRSCGNGSQEPGGGQIILNGTSITVIGGGVVVNGTKATIRSQGTYTISGSLSNGQIAVNTPDPGLVQMILNGVSITSATTAPIYVISAASTEIVLADATANYLTDPNSYVLEDPNNNEPNAALFSDDPLTISGTGSLTVHGNYNDGITSKDSLVINSGTINVTSVDDGIRGKDSLVIHNGTFTVTCGGDGLKSDNAEDTELGYITIENGTFHITSGGDAITAETDVNITGGGFTLLCGGGHTVTIPSTNSAKGVKGLASVTIGGGTFSIDAADDGIHSNTAVTISGGTLTIATNSSTSASYGDGVHSDGTVTITGGTIDVTTCYEGIEGQYLTINNGTIHVTSTDDGINGAGGSGTNNWLHINGGYIVVNAQGDGIDVNGSITMSAGTVIVHGPTADNNAAIDYDTTFNISGGFLVAAGSAGMAQAPSPSSTQRSVKVTYSATKSAGYLAHIQTTSGATNLLTFAPAKQYRSLVFSAPTLTAGLSCGLYRGGTCTGTPTDGLYQGGTYSGGAGPTTFTTTGIVTNVSAP
ncbi:MAG TPA: carbohydrate-binding domain-containing protein [Phycisphaerae bacterium]|nr:carbohydrate-binding domain-containing protein [Phycisphaerae bacterium]